MMNLAIWLKKNGFRADQVQTFLSITNGNRDQRCITPVKTH
jgi:hypothetical protein